MSDVYARGSAPFISKLYEIITNAADDTCIKWGSAGNTIVVTDQVKFAKDELPRYFKHDNIRSFVRQCVPRGPNCGARASDCIASHA